MESRETTETEVTCTEGTTNPSNPLAVSTQCKVCKIDFTESTILKHITFKKSCKPYYSPKEVQLFRQWTRERKNNKRRCKLKSLYNPLNRRERYLKEKKKELPLNR